MTWYLKIMYPLLRMKFAEDGGGGQNRLPSPL
jgi:hypothetical protein